MKVFLFNSIIILGCMSITGCVEDSLSSSKSPSLADSIVDANFKFSTRTACLLNISAINESGNAASNAIFSIYEQDPTMGEDGGRSSSIDPIYQGKTDNSGKLSVNLNISIGKSTLYVYPETAGIGTMQTVSIDNAAAGLIFKGNQLPQTNLSKQSRAGENTTIERNSQNLGVNYKFYSFFTSDEVDSNTGNLNIGTGIVSSEILPEAYKAKVNSMFPEKTFYSGTEGSSDIIITDEYGAEAWVTFISDGGYSTSASNRNIRNGLYYYTYTDENTPSGKYNVSSDEYHLTAIFPNVNPFDGLATGTRVQLLYYDKTTDKYVSTFPKGTHIGFALNYMGYNPGGSIALSKNEYDFALSNKDDCTQNPYCSTPIFNKDSNTHGIIIWDDEYKCYTIGMERAGIADYKGNPGDNDFNDILAKLVFSPVEKQGQTGVITPPEPQPLVVTSEGTLAFEDNWPEMGDYDFNDFVTLYRYTLEKNETTGLVESITLSFTPKAIGAQANNGFGIQLPIQVSNIKAIQGAETESGESLATIIVYSDVREAFGSQSGFINTYPSTEMTSEQKTINISLVEPVSEEAIALSKFNPFLIRDRREKEIHLVDYAPTSKMNMKYFNSTVYENSDVSKGLYYRMNNIYPWALDISSTTWAWPSERKSISTAYPQYDSWYKEQEAGKVNDWTETKDTEQIWGSQTKD